MTCDGTCDGIVSPCLLGGNIVEPVLEDAINQLISVVNAAGAAVTPPFGAAPAVSTQSVQPSD